MAANDEFPRGWTLSSRAAAAGQVAAIHIPAVPGVAHVLDSFTARAVSNAAAAGPIGFLVEILGSTLVLAELYVVPSTVDEMGGTGIGFLAAVGVALDITFDIVTIANVDQLLICQGHNV